MSSKLSKKRRNHNNNKARSHLVNKGNVNEGRPIHALTSEIYQRDHVGVINIEEAMKKSAKAPKSRGPQNLSMAWDETSMGIANAQTRDGLMDERDKKDTYYKVYCNNQWVSGCVDVISKRFTSGGWECVEVEKGKGNPDNQARVNELLLFRNLEENFLQFLRSIATDLLIFGEAFCELVYATDECTPGSVVKVCMIDACTMITHFDEHGQITGYTQSLEKSTRMMQFKPEQIVRWWLPDPKAKKKALSPVQRLLDPVFLEQSYVNWGEKFFKQGARPNFHVEMGEETNEVDAGRFIKFFKENYTGAQNAHVPPVMYGGTKLVESGKGTIEMDFDKGQDKQRDKILVVYGVPPAQLSIIESGNLGGGSGESQNKAFNYNTVDPIAQLILEQFNYRVINEGLGIDDWTIKTRMADYRDDAQISTITDTEVRNGTLSINEARAERGRDPIKGGDVNVIVAGKDILPVESNSSIADNQAQNAALDLEMKKAQVANLKNPLGASPAIPGQQSPNDQQQSDNGQSSQDQTQQDNEGDGGDNDAKETAMRLLQKWCEDQERAKIKEAEHTGVMVGFFLKPSEAEQLAIPGGEPVSQIHLTLTFHGDKSELSSIEDLQKVVADYAASAPTLKGSISGIGRFAPSANSDGLSPIVALPNIPGLQSWRSDLVQHLEAEGFDVANNFEYTPHCTLMYIGKYDQMPLINVPDVKLTFDTLTLAVGDDHYNYPLNNIDEMMPLEALSLVAGYGGSYGFVEATDGQGITLLGQSQLDWEAYNPDQPRDANGRWGSGGGDSSSSGGATKQQSWKSFWDDFEFKSDKAASSGTSADAGQKKTSEPEPEGSSDETKSFDDMSVEEKEQYLQENGGKEWEESLSDAEKSAITNYTNSGYFTMQDILRDDAKADKYWKGQIKDATSGLMKGSAPEDMMVTRVTGAAEMKLMSGLEGEGYVAKGFTSTTIDPSFRGTSLMRMHISIPKGSPGAYVASVSGHADEREWLLPPNSKFRVDSISGNEANLTYIGVYKSKK